MASPGPSPAPSVAVTPPAAPDPTLTTPSATDAAPAPRPARSRISRSLGLPLAAAGIVGVILVVTLILIQQRQSSTGSVASAGPTAGAASGSPTAAPTRAAAATPFDTIQLTGTGSGDVAFSIPDGASGLATITNEGTGPFIVWTVAADGARNDQIVNTIGDFAGTLLFDENKHSTTFSVESDGDWSIEVKRVPLARTWDASERLVGDGPDVILVVPPTVSDATMTVRYDGTSNFAVAVYASRGKQKLLNVVGPFNGPMPLPAGSSVIEVEADDAWSIDPG